MPRLFRCSPLLALLLGVLSCVPVEVDPTPTGVPVQQMTPSTGITPVMPATRAPVSPSPSPTIEAQVTSCDDPRPVVAATVVSSQSASPSATPEAPAPPVSSGQRLSSPIGVQSPSPVPATALTPDFALEASLRQLLGSDIDGYGVVAMDLETGRGVAINGDTVFYAASVFKVWVMLEVFHQESLGLFSFDDRLVITPYYEGFGLGPRATEQCGAYTVTELLQAMMSISDNSAAVLLQDLVGAPNINTSLESLGLKASALTTEDITITADDTALLLQIIASGTGISRQASEAMASLLLTETFDNGFVAGLPPGTVAGHKTGNWANARHDVGIVFTGETTYVAAILSDNRDGSLAMTKAIATLLYEAFATP